MSGICGFIGARDESLLDRMLARMKWRGGFPQKFFRGGDFGLGVCHEEPSPEASSPSMLAFNENKSVCVVCDGYISDEANIRARLSASGHEFKTNSPSETIAHAYEEHGIGFIDVFKGGFSFAIWDESEFLLVLGRDRFGVKPLCFCVSQDKLLFASSASALRACEPEFARLDVRSLDAHIAFGYIPGERTMFENITRLSPGHLMICRRGAVRVSKYWEPCPVANFGSNSESDWLEDTTSALGDSLSRLKSDSVPLTCIIESPFGVASNKAAALTIALAGGQIDIFEPDPANVSFFESSAAPVEPDFSRITTLMKAMDEPPSDFSFLLLDSVISNSARSGSRIASAAGLAETLGAGELHRLILSLSGIADMRLSWTRYIAIAILRRAPRFLPGLNSVPISGSRVATALSGCESSSDIPDAILCVAPKYLRLALYTPQVASALSGSFSSHSGILSNHSNSGSPSTASISDYLLRWPLASSTLPRLDAVSAVNKTSVEFPFLDPSIVELAMSFPERADTQNSSSFDNIANYYAVGTQNRKKRPAGKSRRVHPAVTEFIDTHLTEERVRARGFFKWEQVRVALRASDMAPAISLALLEAWCDCHSRSQIG